MRKRKQGQRIAAVLLAACFVLAGPTAARAEGLPFPDVRETDWYYASLARICEERPGVIGGMEDGRFVPQGDTTRAQFVKMLCVFSGEGAEPGFFTDYPGNTDYSDVSGWAAPYIQWASEKGLAGGNGDGTFSPEGSISREQIAVVLQRYAEEMEGLELQRNENALYPFYDAGRASSWAVQALQWAVTNRILNGDGTGHISPGGRATRAEVVTMLCNYLDFREGGGDNDPPPQEELYYRVTSTGGLNLRGGPGQTYPSLEVLPYGAVLAVLEAPAGGAWLRVRAPSGKTGYVSAEYVTAYDPDAAFTPKFTVKDGVRVIDAPFIDQRVKYPTGCESVTAVMALKYLGVDITVERFIDKYLPRGQAPHYNSRGQYVGCDPRKEFPGNPYSESGWGCYAPVIAGSLEKIVEPPDFSVREYKGVSLDALCGQYVDEGIPVLVWATMGMAPPRYGSTFTIEGTGEQFTWISPLHCLLLVGRDSGYYYFNDPLEGKCVKYRKSAVENAYAGLGKQAVVVQPG